MDTETLTPPVDTGTAESSPAELGPESTESVSIADHAEQFQPEPTRPETPEQTDKRRELAATQRRDDAGRWDEGRVRHRAQSQKAGVEDVKAINDLTRQLRTKEDELFKARPEAGQESPRIRALKRQIKAIESELSEVTPSARPSKTVQATPQPIQLVNTPASGAPVDVSKEPQLEDFLQDADPYAAYMKQWSRWDRKREQVEVQQQQASDVALRAEQEIVSKYEQRTRAFAAQTPDFTASTSALMQENLPMALIRAIAKDDNGPAFVYHLAHHPTIKDDMVLMTYQRDPRDDDFVAAVQRRLSQHVAAVKTGSAPAPRAFTPPRPPNPVRTGSVQTTDTPPGEGSSIEDHRRYYGPQNRR